MLYHVKLLIVNLNGYVKNTIKTDIRNFLISLFNFAIFVIGSLYRIFICNKELLINMASEKPNIMKQCPHCGALFGAKGYIQHVRACKEKHENINKEMKQSHEKKQTPPEQNKTVQNPSKKFKAVLIIPLILILMLMKLSLSTIYRKEKKETTQTPQETITQSRYLMRRS